MANHAVSGSARAPLPGAVAVGKADPNERLEVTVILRRASALPPAHEGKRVTREAFAAQYGARDDDIAAIRKFAQAHHLSVVQSDAARRTVILSGTVADFNAAFDVDLQRFQHPGGTYRGRVGEVHVPPELKDVVEAVLGLDNRPQAEPHFRLSPTEHTVRPASVTSETFTPLQLATLYGFPAGTGSGTCVAIIELGGGFRTRDLTTYFAKINVPQPNVVAVSIDHATNSPTNAQGDDVEVMLDIEVAGAVAPSATIAVYFAPNTDAGFLDAITTAVHDPTNKPSVISISWGGPESTWTGQAMTAMDEAFQSAAALGISVCVAAGDNGATDGQTDGQLHVDFPASSPHVLACGGTTLHAASGVISQETVWNEGAQGGSTGGGISAFFALPTWQSGLSAVKSGGTSTALTMRGVPDVCGDADPVTGYEIRVDGENTTIGGTSAVAPLWAGLIARINAGNTAVGFVNSLLYQSGAAFNDIRSGDNGGFSAAAGWDACTGLGSPRGAAIATALHAQFSLAGNSTIRSPAKRDGSG